MLSFNISYPYLIIFPYFLDTTKKGIGAKAKDDFTNNFNV